MFMQKQYLSLQSARKTLQRDNRTARSRRTARNTGASRLQRTSRSTRRARTCRPARTCRCDWSAGTARRNGCDGRGRSARTCRGDWSAGTARRNGCNGRSRSARSCRCNGTAGTARSCRRKLHRACGKHRDRKRRDQHDYPDFADRTKHGRDVYRIK